MRVAAPVHHRITTGIAFCSTTQPLKSSSLFAWTFPCAALPCRLGLGVPPHLLRGTTPGAFYKAHSQLWHVSINPPLTLTAKALLVVW